MPPSDILSVPSRRRIYECVLANPGAHLRDLARRCALPLGTTLYHLDCLEDAGLLASRRDGRYKRYFGTSGMGRRDKELLSLLRHAAPRRLVYALLLRGPSTQRELCGSIGASRSTVSFHLNRLTVEGAIAREPARPEARYVVAEPEATRALLDRYHLSLSAEDHARFALPPLGAGAALASG